jgi:hypothetical protein
MVEYAVTRVRGVMLLWSLLNINWERSNLRQSFVTTLYWVSCCDFSAFISIPNIFPVYNKYKYYSFSAQLEATKSLLFADKTESLNSWFKREYRMFWCLWLDQFRWPKLQIMSPSVPFPTVPGIFCPWRQEPIDLPLYSSHTTPKFNVKVSTCECYQFTFRDILQCMTGYCSFRFSTHGF